MTTIIGIFIFRVEDKRLSFINLFLFNHIIGIIYPIFSGCIFFVYFKYISPEFSMPNLYKLSSGACDILIYSAPFFMDSIFNDAWATIEQNGQLFQT